MAKLKFLGADSGKLPRIDRYELIAEIATGGMATVFLGRILGVGGFERLVAIKRLHPHLGADESFVKMFLDEARLVANIRHQHVVPVLEVGAGDEGYYLVMEYIEGETLGTVLSRSTHGGHRLPPKVAVRIVLDTLAGLHAAHELVDQNGEPVGLVHRDVSPQNILLDVHGVARIADFGVAHATSRLGSTRAGQLKGKVAYMAPEQARGDRVTRRADVFAAGVVLWEALTLKRLFMAENEAVTLNRLIFEPIPKLRAGNPTLPASVEKILERALDRDQDRRFATAAEFARELEATARAARMLGDTSDVKAYLGDVLGEQTEERRGAIRAHLAFVDQPRDEPVSAPADEPAPRPARPEPVLPPPGSTASSAAMTLPTKPAASDEEVLGLDDVIPKTSPGMDVAPPQPRRSWAVLAAVSSVVAVAAVGVAVFVSRSSGEVRGAVLSGDAPVSPSPPTVSQGTGAATRVAGVASADAAQPEDGKQDGGATDAGLDAPAPKTVPSVLPRTGGDKGAGTTTPVEPGTAVPTGTGMAPPADTDDLKKNPYR